VRLPASAGAAALDANSELHGSSIAVRCAGAGRRQPCRNTHSHSLGAREQLTLSYHDPVARGPGGLLVMWLPKVGRQTSSGTTYPLLFMCSDIWLSSEPSGRHSTSTLHELC